MSSGRVHDTINTVMGLGVLGAGLVTYDPLVLSMAGGIFVGTWWLSPDLDLERSNPSNRLGFVKILYSPYRALCGHHRSFVSHSPIVSNAIRVAYTLAIILGVAACIDKEKSIVFLLYDPKFFWFYLGLEMSTCMHIFLDWQYSVKRKLLK